MLARSMFVASFMTLVACGSDASGSSASSSQSAEANAKSKPSGAAGRGKPGKSGGAVVSCNDAKMGICSEWRGLDDDEKREAKDSCNDPGSAFGSEPCTRDKLLGTCEHKSEKITLFIYPAEAIKDAAAAKEMCDDGVFTPAAK